MQGSNGGSRLKLNRNAFKHNHSLVVKRRRPTESEGTDPVAEKQAAGSVGPQDAHHQEPSRITTEYNRRTPGQSNEGSSRAPCSPQDCWNNNNHNNNNASGRKQIRCHLHLALRFCGSEKAARRRTEAEQRVPRCVNADVRVRTSGSSADRTESRAGSAGEGASKSGVKTEQIRLEAPGKKDGPTADLKSNLNIKMGLRKHSGSVSRLGTGRQVKRSVKNPCCALCGDVKYTPPVHKKRTCAYKAGSKCLSHPSRLEQTIVRSVARAQMTTRLIIWFRRHLKVKLCDVARVFDVTSRDFSCTLPAMLLQNRKHTSEKCFSKEFRSLMHLDPQGNENYGMWIGNQSWEVCTPTNSCASLSLGNGGLEFSVGERILDVADDVEGRSESSDKQIFRTPECEGMRPSSNEGTACVSLNLGTVQHCVVTVGERAEESKVRSKIQQVKAGSIHQVSPLLMRRVNACNGFDSSQCSELVNLTDSFSVSKTNRNDNYLVENELTDDSEGDVDSFDSFTCQRTTAYMVYPRTSCSRTYRPWPFPRHGPPCEMKALIRTGPRWIVTTEVSEGSRNVSDNQQMGSDASSECTAGNTAQDGLKGFEPHDGHDVFQDGQEQVQSTIPSKTVLASATLKETLNGHSPNIGENDSQDMRIHSPSVMSSDKLIVIPAGSISTVDINAVGLRDSFINGTQSPMPCNSFKDNENGKESTTFHLPDPLPDHLPRAFQMLSCIVHPRNEPQIPTVMVPPRVEPNDHSLMTVHSREQQISNTDLENKSHCSLNVLHTKTAEQNAFSSTPTGSSSWDISSKSITKRHLFSASKEDIRSLVLAKRPEEDNKECILKKYEMCEMALVSSVVTGGDLDVLRAYEDDAIVLDVIQDDPDLFGVIVMGTTENLASKADPAALQRGKNTCMQTDQTIVVRKPNRIIWDLESGSSGKNVQKTADGHVENLDIFCRGKVNEQATGSISQRTFDPKCPPVDPIVKQEQMVPDFDDNLNKKESTDLNGNMTGADKARLVDEASTNVHSSAGKDVNIVRPSPNSYCWYYFSEHHSCFRNVCWFLHVPRDDDEKLCMDVVQRFCLAGSPPIVQRAVEIFVTYYKTNSPGASFSPDIVNHLLSTLLSLALPRDLVSVINTLIAHKRVPPSEIVMALYEHVRQRGILGFVPELILLTSKIIALGCVFSVEQCEMMQLHLETLHVPRKQMDIFCTVKCRALATNPHTAQLSELAQAVVRVEIYKQQEDWHALARVFCAVFGGRHSAGELSRFCCCVTMALLKETKDKLSLPFLSFADSVCQGVTSDDILKSFLGRVGVSLMFSYYRTQDWVKGLKLLSVMSRLRVEFTRLKGLFSSEDGTSRCQLITIATEFFLNNGSIEGALNMLKANEWFVSSKAWPCEQADIQNRRRVLTLLSEKTSYRDTLEVLTNLPGLKRPVDGVQASKYSTVFNAHLQRCVTNHVLPVAADTLDFMLTQGVAPATSELQQLLHKLGKQNSWSRARILFQRAHCAGYYSGVVCEKDRLVLPCNLTEIEMTLAFEMFIARNCTSLQNPTDSSQPLLITLKRHSGSEVAVEGVYLAAGCRVLSAALIPNPKLSIRYTAVSQEQEQLFNLDRGSAAKWLSHNRSWAQGMWTSTDALTQAKTAVP